MTTVKQIRFLALADLILTIVAVTAILYFESYLPTILQEYLQKEMETDLTITSTILYIIVIVAFIINIVSLFGLYFIKIWAKKYFIVSIVLLYPLSFFAGPNVEHAIGCTLDQFAILTDGMLLALLIFTSAYNESVISKSANMPLQ